MAEQQTFDFENLIVVDPNPDVGENMAKITVVGVGGGGCNMIDNFCEKNQYRIKIIAANTDNQVLKSSKTPIKLQLGPKTTKGLGAGMNPNIGEQAAFESQKEIEEQLSGSDMVFICTGLGGGTGSGAAPVIAQIAKKMGILTVAVVTIPFSFEMGREPIAQNALMNIKPNVDAYMVIYNDKILEMVTQTTGVDESFKIIDDVLFNAVHNLCEIILAYQRNNWNIDFADISTTLTGKGQALIGIGHQAGNESGVKALQDAIDSPLLNIDSINGAKSVLVHIKVNKNYPIHEINKLMHFIKESSHLGAKCITGTVYDNKMPDDEVKVTLIATGFDVEEPKDKKTEQLVTDLEEVDEPKNFWEKMKRWF